MSPRYHGYFLISRLRSNLVTRPLQWRLVSAAWLVVLVFVMPSAFGALAVGLTIWLPLVLGYQASALLQFLTEHLWLLSEHAPEQADEYAQRCFGRFCGEALPAKGRVFGWAGWWFRTVLVHIPVRFGVLVGDLPAHDWHHLCGFVRQNPAEWPSAIFVRQQAIDTGLSMGMELREFWGMCQMLDHVLTSLSKAPHIAEFATLRPQSEHIV